MKIALVGYGKMGRAIEKIALSKGHEISHKVETQEDLASLTQNSPHVAIEFTQPESAFKNIEFCLQNSVPVISGTTGWLDRYAEISTLCEKHSGTFLHSSNFSVGVNLFFELNEWLAQRMKSLNFHCEMEEIHHTEKKDSPSGTAVKLFEGIQKVNSEVSGWINEESTDHTKIGIISKRIPNVPGTHTVSYSSPLESINIQHTAHDRSVFADGALMVAEWICDKKGVFNMSDFIKKESNS